MLEKWCTVFCAVLPGRGEAQPQGQGHCRNTFPWLGQQTGLRPRGYTLVYIPY